MCHFKQATYTFPALSRSLTLSLLRLFTTLIRFQQQIIHTMQPNKSERHIFFFAHSVHRQLVLFDAIMRFDGVSSGALVFLSVASFQRHSTLSSASWFNFPFVCNFFCHLTLSYILTLSSWLPRVFHFIMFFSWMYRNTWQTMSICRLKTLFFLVAHCCAWYQSR